MVRTQNNRARMWLLSMILLACVGCAVPRGGLLPRAEGEYVWPAPPEQGRVRYVGTISTQKDMTKDSGWSLDLSELIFGEKEYGVLVAPAAVAVDPRGTMLVADSAGGVVHLFNLPSGRYLQFASIGEGRKLRRPVGLTLVESYVYVADSQLHQVCVFDLDGAYKFSFGDERLIRPSGIAYSAPDGRVFVADAGRHTVEIFDKTGRHVGRIGERGAGPGQFNFPTCLWMSRDGKLYVSDTLNYRVQVFTSSGSYMMMFGEHGDRPGYFAHPSGIATDSFGHIYVTDRQFENVQIFDATGEILMAFGQEGGDVGEFWLPSGVFIDARNWIYVADTFNKRIQVFELMEADGGR